MVPGDLCAIDQWNERSHSVAAFDIGKVQRSRAQSGLLSLKRCRGSCERAETCSVNFAYNYAYLPRLDVATNCAVQGAAVLWEPPLNTA